MRRATLPLPNTPSWPGSQLKHRDNFTLLYFTLCMQPPNGNLWVDVQNVYPINTGENTHLFL
jgi:hypothetical protein